MAAVSVTRSLGESAGGAVGSNGLTRRRERRVWRCGTISKSCDDGRLITGGELRASVAEGILVFVSPLTSDKSVNGRFRFSDVEV